VLKLVEHEVNTVSEKIKSQQPTALHNGEGLSSL
jgi:hypothetical protein